MMDNDNCFEKGGTLMKKLIIGVMLTIAVLCLAACGGSSVKVGSFSSRYFNGDDYDNAVQEVFTYFSDWEMTLSRHKRKSVDWRLSRLWY